MMIPLSSTTINRVSRNHTASMGKTTFGQVRRSRRARQGPPPVDNDSSDDSTPGGVSLRDPEN